MSRRRNSAWLVHLFYVPVTKVTRVIAWIAFILGLVALARALGNW